MNERSRPLVFFRADGSTQMGLGHLYRSAALAMMLPSFRRVLVTAADASILKNTIREAFDEVLHLSEEKEATDFLQLIGRYGEADPPLVVLDGYHFGMVYQREIKARVSGLVAIDDIHAYPFLADLVINHSPVSDLPQRYRLSERTILAHGLAYGLLRQPFLRTARSAEQQDRGSRFFICFGGSDALNVTTQLINWLSQLGYKRPLDVVLGPANPHADTVADAAKRYVGKVTLFQALNDEQMIERYQQAALAFLPASTTLLEAMAVGVPTVIGYYVDNQRDIYRGFIDRQLAHGIGDWTSPTRLGETISAALENSSPQPSTVLPNTPHLRPRPIDGYSGVNLRLAFEQLAEQETLLLCRPAEVNDARQYFAWVNEPTVRQSAVRTEPIAWENHLRWFTNRVGSPRSLLLYFSTALGPCGQLRYDLDEKGGALIDIGVDPAQRGRGLARRMLELGEKQLVSRKSEASTQVAYVKPANVASARTFERAGFERRGQTVENGTVLWKFEKQLRRETADR